MIRGSSNKIMPIISWCEEKNITCDLDMLISDPTHNHFVLYFDNNQDEFVVKMKFGL